MISISMSLIILWFAVLANISLPAAAYPADFPFPFVSNGGVVNEQRRVNELEAMIKQLEYLRKYQKALPLAEELLQLKEKLAQSLPVTRSSC